MKRMIATMVLAASALTGAALHASTPNNTFTVAAPSHQKLVSFQIRNASPGPLTVKAGDTEMTLAPGKSVAVKLPVGTEITSLTASAHHPLGTVLTVVSSAIADATVTVD